MNKVNELEEIYSKITIKPKKVETAYLDELSNKAINFGANKTIIINPKQDIIFEERVKLLCANNCERYGTKLTCPPYLPDIDFEKAIKEYDQGLLVIVKRESEFFETNRNESTNSLHKILLKLEKEAFDDDYFFSTSFIGGSCKLCAECGDVCKQPKYSRIPFEATGANIVKTLEKYNLFINFPAEKNNYYYRIGLFLVGK